MAQVETIDGPLDTERLGTTLMHEHIFNLTPELQQTYPGFHGWDPDVEVPKAREKLREAKEAGIDTMVELTVVGTGRDVELMAAAVEGTGLQVIVSTGLYTYDVLPRLWHFSGPGTLLDGEEEMDDLFLRDIQEGIQGTGIKAGMLKCAIDHVGLTDHCERVMRSVCRVHRQTGTPITVHTHAETERGRDALRVLEEEGVDPRRVVIAHCNDTTDVDYLSDLAESGALLGMDRFGLDVLLPMEERVGAVVGLVERGYGDQVVLSQDANCFTDWFAPGLKEQISPRWHYLHVLQDVVPALKERGVSDEQVDRMLVGTPRDFFANAAG